MRIGAALVVCGCLVGGMPALGQAPRLTSVPLTYVLDYGPRHVGAPGYVEAVGKAPPTLLHLGKDVPLTHNWGPIQALGGENQAYGKRRPFAKEDFIRRLSPDETSRRIDDLRSLVDALHRSGVKCVTPYICSMTIGGRPDTRAGFWEFYDHWNDYRPLGLGERPAADPIEWMQRTADGSLQFFYKFAGDFYPPYEPNVRYAACQNHPDWRAWTEVVVRQVARCGFDGVFVDNAGSLRCYCPWCQRKWRAWIDGRYPAAQRQELFGTEQPGLGSDRQPGLLWAETCRFWNASLAEHLAAIGRAGQKELGRPFLVFPNGGEHRPEQVLLAFADTDLIMFERSSAPYGTHPGMVRWPIVEDIAVKRYNDNVFENKFVQCLRRKVRPILLTAAGYQIPAKVRRILEMNPGTAALGCAETAAFGGGGGFLVRQDADCMQVQKKYRDFQEQRPALFDGLDSFAQVALACFPQQVYFGNPRHIVEIRRATEQLLDGHVLFDYLIEDQFDEENLRRYAAVVLPYVTHLSQRRLTALESYIRSGGIAVQIGPAPEFDDLGRRLPTPAFLAAADNAPAAVHGDCPNFRGDAAKMGLSPSAVRGQAHFSTLRARKMSQSPAACERLHAPGPATRELGKGKVVVAERLPPGGAPLGDWVERAAGRSLAAIAAPQTPLMAKVRVSVFRQPGANRYVVHLVNYNVPLGVEPREPELPGPIEVALPLDPPVTAAHLTCYDPLGASAELPGKVEDGRLRFTVPDLRIHKIVEVCEGR